MGGRGGEGIQSWLGGTPSNPDWGEGTPSSLGWGDSPSSPDQGVPPSPDLGCGNPPLCPDLGWGTPHAAGWSTPIHTWDGVTPPPVEVWTDKRTENSTFPHPSDAGGNKPASLPSSQRHKGNEIDNDYKIQQKKCGYPKRHNSNKRNAPNTITRGTVTGSLDQ